MKLFNKFFNKKPEKKSIIDFITNAGGDIITGTTSFTTLSLHGYERNPISSRCIDRIAEAMAMPKPKLYQEKIVDGVLKKVEIKNHPALDLLYRPNPLNSLSSLLTEAFINYGIGGELFLQIILVNNKPTEIWSISPDQVQVSYDITKDAINYRILSKNITITASGANDYKSEILHFKRYNPRNKLRGLSKMVSAGLSIASFNRANEWNEALLKNGANPSGALKAKNALTTEEYNRLKAQLKEQYTGTQNSGTPLLLEGDMEWQPLSLNPKDLDFNNGVLTAARNICSAYGVPSQLVGVMGESTYSNYEHALISFWQDTILPLSETFIKAINNWLLDFYKEDNIFFEFDYNNIPALEARKETLFNRIRGVVNDGIMSINEGRVLLGLDEFNIDNLESENMADVLFINSGKMPINEAGELMAEAEKDYAQSLEEVRNNAGAESEDTEE